MQRRIIILVGAASLALSVGPAAAQTATRAASTPHSAISIQCSKEADAKGLHGKSRKAFRSQCKAPAAANPDRLIRD